MDACVTLLVCPTPLTMSAMSGTMESACATDVALRPLDGLAVPSKGSLIS
jgi:hypothetical protein